MTLRIIWGAKPFFILSGLMCAAAIALALLAAMGRGDTGLAVGLFLLGLGQLAALALWQMDRSAALAHKTAAELKALERRVAILTEVRPPVHAKPHKDISTEPKPEMPAGPAPAAMREEHLDFYLEPVIDLSNGRTAHYRASVMLRMADGMRFGMESVQRGAERAGVKPLLETLTLARALPALRRLQERGRSAMIFAPASAESFAAEEFLSRVEEILDAGDQVAAGVILEVSEAALASLSDAGMAGITRLADRGVSFCLANASAQGPVPATLASLGFRFVMMEANLLGGSDPDMFAHACMDAGIEIIAAHVDTREQLSRLQGYTSLGHGTVFAPPRLVRDMRQSEGSVAA